VAKSPTPTEEIRAIHDKALRDIRTISDRYADKIKARATVIAKEICDKLRPRFNITSVEINPEPMLHGDRFPMSPLPGTDSAATGDFDYRDINDIFWVVEDDVAFSECVHAAPADRDLIIELEGLLTAMHDCVPHSSVIDVSPTPPATKEQQHAEVQSSRDS